MASSNEVIELVLTDSTPSTITIESLKKTLDSNPQLRTLTVINRCSSPLSLPNYVSLAKILHDNSHLTSIEFQNPLPQGAPDDIHRPQPLVDELLCLFLHALAHNRTLTAVRLDIDDLFYSKTVAEACTKFLHENKTLTQLTFGRFAERTFLRAFFETIPLDSALQQVTFPAPFIDLPTAIKISNAVQNTRLRQVAFEDEQQHDRLNRHYFDFRAEEHRFQETLFHPTLLGQVQADMNHTLANRSSGSSSTSSNSSSSNSSSSSSTATLLPGERPYKATTITLLPAEMVLNPNTNSSDSSFLAEYPDANGHQHKTRVEQSSSTGLVGPIYFIEALGDEYSNDVYLNLAHPLPEINPALIISAIAHNKTLTHVSIAMHFGIMNEQLRALADIIKTNSRMRTLHLTGITTRETNVAMAYFMDALAVNHSLTEVHLGWQLMHFNDGKGPQENFTTTIQACTQMLRSNHTLNELYFGDFVPEHLISQLVQGVTLHHSPARSLTSLGFPNPRLTYTEASRILRALAETTSLVSLDFYPTNEGIDETIQEEELEFPHDADEEREPSSFTTDLLNNKQLSELMEEVNAVLLPNKALRASWGLVSLTVAFVRANADAGNPVKYSILPLLSSLIRSAGLTSAGDPPDANSRTYFLTPFLNKLDGFTHTRYFEALTEASTSTSTSTQPLLDENKKRKLIQ